MTEKQLAEYCSSKTEDQWMKKYIEQTTIQRDIALQIRWEIKEQHITITDLAIKAGVSRATIHKLLNQRACNLTNLVKITQALGKKVTIE